MKILIADDESLTRVNIKTMLSFGGYSECSIFEAKDGTQALKLIERVRPDLVFLDIRMPGMDGLSVLKYARESGFSAKIVMLSSYNEFDMVRQALRQGADDYIHKSALTQDELLSIVEGMVNTAGQGWFTKHTKQLQAIALTRRHVMKSILLGEVLAEETDELLSQYFPELCGSGLICLILEVKDYETVQSRYNGDVGKRWLISLENLLAETFSGEPPWIFTEVYKNKCTLVFRMELVSESACNAWVTALVSRAHTNLKQFLNVELRFGVSKRRKPKELPQMFAEARDALDGGYFRSNEIVFFVRNNIPDLTNRLQVLEDIINHSKSAMREANYDEALLALEELSLTAPRISLEGSYGRREALAQVGLLYFELLEQWDKAELSRESPAFLSFEKLSAFETFQMLIDSVRGMLLAVKEKALRTAFFKTGSRVSGALEYINNNLNKDMSLEEVATHLGLTPGYFSRVFKKSVGLTFSAYLQNCRVERAAVLLRDTELKIYEISRQFGYNNVEYFNRVFLKLKGMSPKEYRNRQKKG